MSLSLSQGQVQTILQYLYSDRAELRREAIRHTLAQKWNDAHLMQALAELEMLDQAEDVRKAAREALRELEGNEG